MKLKHTIDESNGGHNKGFQFGIACSNDGEWLVSSGLSNSLWETKSWHLANKAGLKLQFTLNESNGGHNARINDVIFSPRFSNSGIRLFYTASEDFTIKQINAANDQTESGLLSTAFDTEPTNLAVYKGGSIAVRFRNGALSAGSLIKNAKSQFFVVVSDKYLASVPQPSQNQIEIYDIETGKMDNLI